MVYRETKLNANLNDNAIISNGLSLTWGTIAAGGYTQIGKMVIINIRVTPNSVLNINSQYLIHGFPAVKSPDVRVVPIQHNSPERMSSGMMEPSGDMLFVPKSDLPANVALLFGACYITP
ncbi:hypothetical protein AALB39_28800 [Lachnospiraceae bacterium 54-53]